MSTFVSDLHHVNERLFFLRRFTMRYLSFRGRGATGRQVLLLLFVNLFLCFSAVGASDCMIEGQVIDEETGQPIPGVNILVEGTQLGTSTDLDGQFSLVQLPSEKKRVIVSFMGYRSEVVEVDLESIPNHTLDIKLIPSAFELSPVVVTGTRTHRFTKDAPVRTDVITARDLEMRSASNLYEALETTAGVRVEQQCQACNFTQIRVNGLGSDHTQILMDGQPVYSGLASVYGLQQFSTAEVDRIEVVKGAGSALYGSNAIAGAVNIITARPTRNRIKAGFEMGSYGTNQYDASAEMVRDNSALHVFAQLNKEEAIDKTRDGFDRDEVYEGDGITDRVESDARNIGINAFHSNLLKQNDEVFVRFRYMNEVRKGGEMTGDSYLNPYTEGTEHITTDRVSGTLGYRTQFTEVDGFDVQFTAVQHKRNATNDTYLGDYMDTHDGAMPDVSVLRPYMAEEDMFITSLNYTRQIKAHNLTLGAQYSYDELEESGRYVIVDEDDALYGQDYTSVANKHANDFGVYLQDEWRVSPHWEVVAGIRTDIHNSEDEFAAEDAAFAEVFEASTYDETSYSPRVALKWAPTYEWVFRTTYGTGFKVPFGFSEDLHLCSGSPRVWKSPSLEPETSQSVNVSADYTGSLFTAGVSAYYTRLENAVGIASASAGARAKGYDYEYENIDAATVLGVDVSTRVPITRRFQVSADVSYFQGEYDDIRDDWAGTVYAEDSKNISRYPNLSGGIRLDWNPGKWETTLDARYTGSMFIDYAADGDVANDGSKVFESDPYVLFNTQISYNYAEHYRLYVGARNLGDYIQAEKHVDDAAFFYAPVYGRMLYGGVRVEF